MASIKLMNTLHTVVANVFEHEEEYMILLQNMRRARQKWGFTSPEFQKAYDAIDAKGQSDLAAKGYEWTEEFNDIVFTVLAEIDNERFEEA